LEEQGKVYKFAESRTYDRAAVLDEIEAFGATHVLNAAGVTGRPNVDWCEDHRVETVRSNVIGTLVVADACEVKGVHHTLFATGCIFEYDEEHQIGLCLISHCVFAVHLTYDFQGGRGLPKTTPQTSMGHTIVILREWLKIF
jgi:hypothetical protein